MKSVAIIGAGRLGTSIGRALSEKGYTINALSCLSISSAEESQQKIGQGYASTDNVRTADQGEIVFLTVPDDTIAHVVQELTSSPLSWKGKYVFHCSGLLTSSVLHPLQTKGAHTASVHPCYSFPKKQSRPDLFQDIYFALEGEDLAVAAAKDITGTIGALHINIRAEDKASYHTACSLASNMSVALLYTAITLLNKCGIREDNAKKVLWPLLEGTLHNVNKIDIFEALTGPVARGDLSTVRKHLAELEQSPLARRIYVDLARQALEMAKRRDKIPKDKVSVLEALLEHE
jgi:predicted short-subunit dehydrogenase-like oxidoreductase (DUF2520 family)